MSSRAPLTGPPNATIQRTLNQLTAAGLLRCLDLHARKKQYEKVYLEHRELLIDSATGRRLEFHSKGIEELLKHALVGLGYRLLDYRLELFGVPEPESEADAARPKRGPRH